MHPSATDRGTVLLRIARASIAASWSGAAPGLPEAGWVRAPGASFVTLRLDEALRGCIGSLEARRPLGADVAANARAAAFRDPRFLPLAHEELAFIRVEVSVLSATEAVRFEDEADALARLRPGVDGIVLECEGRRGTFLPQVWEQLPDPADFLAHLKMKAGLGAGFWSPAVRLHRYTVEKWVEPGAAAAQPAARERLAS